MIPYLIFSVPTSNVMLPASVLSVIVTSYGLAPPVIMENEEYVASYESTFIDRGHSHAVRRR